MSNSNNYVPMTADQQWLQRQAEDAYEDQRHFCRASTDAQIQAEKEVAVYAAKQAIQTQRQEQNLWRKIYESEKKRTAYDEIAITPEGTITATTRNLYENAPPRIITNMRHPSLDHLFHLENPDESAYVLTAKVADASVNIFLDSEKTGSGSYLVRKFAARGITILSKTTAQQKSFAQFIISALLTQKLQVYYIPDNSGWAFLPEDGFLFFEEGELTWKKIQKLVK